ncbi:hypothetical protein CsSME_00034619 [Camellia sinensis var. sinensis]
MLLHSVIFWSSLSLPIDHMSPHLEMVLVQSLDSVMTRSNSLASKWKFAVFPSSSRRRFSKSRAYMNLKLNALAYLEMFVLHELPFFVIFLLSINIHLSL